MATKKSQNKTLVIKPTNGKLNLKPLEKVLDTIGINYDIEYFPEISRIELSVNEDSVHINVPSICHVGTVITCYYGFSDFKQIILHINENAAVYNYNIKMKVSKEAYELLKDHDNGDDSAVILAKEVFDTLEYKLESELENNLPLWVRSAATSRQAIYHDNVEKIFAKLKTQDLYDIKSLRSIIKLIESKKISIPVRESSTPLLIGYDVDSRYPFISQLPKLAKTLKEAHKLLLPANLPKDTEYYRQGEFFFVKVNSIDKFESINFYNNYDLNTSFARRSSRRHIAEKVITTYHPSTGFTMYVTGYVFADNHATHKFNNNIYKVLLNNEVDMDGTYD